MSIQINAAKKVACKLKTSFQVTKPSLQLIRTSINDCIVVVPTYNEKDNIIPMVTALKQLPIPVDILVVDDNSPDGTAEIVQKLIERYKGLYLIKRPKKKGLGSAYKDGFGFAVRNGWKYICQMDADFSHEPADVCRLLAACREGADVAIGSRYKRGGKIEGWPLKRWLISRTANLYAQILTRSRIKDLTGGFKCFTRGALEKINLNHVNSEGYVFQVEMNYRAAKQGLRIERLPICFTDRIRGFSKLGKDEAINGAKQLLKLVFNKNIHKDSK